MNKEKILNIIKFIYFILILISPITFIFTIVLAWPIWILGIYLGVVLAIYLMIHIIRVKTYVYICPKCNYEFGINILKDISSYNAKTGAKVLTCPNCNTKEVMQSKLKSK